MVPLWSPGDAIVVSGATVPKGATLDARGIAVVVKGCRLLHCRDRTTLMCTGVMVGTTKLPDPLDPDASSSCSQKRRLSHFESLLRHLFTLMRHKGGHLHLRYLPLKSDFAVMMMMKAHRGTGAQVYHVTGYVNRGRQGTR